MSVQPAPSTRSVRQPARRERPARHKTGARREMNLPALTEDDAIFVALATIDLLERLKHEPL